ncbi:MAG: hypothetical protein AABX07_00540 [Nanoarchaeota archaeon]
MNKNGMGMIAMIILIIIILVVGLGLWKINQQKTNNTSADNTQDASAQAEIQTTAPEITAESEDILFEESGINEIDDSAILSEEELISAPSD